MATAARSRRSPAVLLRAINPVGKPVVRSHVIELSGGLVVPTAPSLATIARDYRALIISQNHALRLVGINPQLMIIVATGLTLQHRERLSTIARTIQPGVRHIDRVRIF